ncbi:hypothetical protein SFC43_13485 [Bacteroides sp. CR5/BHMF/2]|nr:hypothetical protein [Bacteroides sp. CR5/BHMF/2]
MERNYPIECHCHQCGSVTVIYVREADYVKRISGRSPVQNCFSYLTMPERETVISGMCVECQRGVPAQLRQRRKLGRLSRLPLLTHV